jgi:hypothetical protein
MLSYEEAGKALLLMDYKKNEITKSQVGISLQKKRLKKGGLALLGTQGRRVISLVVEVAEAAQQMRMLALLEQLWFLPYGQYISGVGQVQA